ncbi:MAG TPA: hypothetical protein VFG07_07380 [Thermoplasmata archaeon]|nr:hypothetical protein [Thermoplasmata archaeon]
MKNQYFGDLNDYRKYSLIRALTGRGRLAATVCWALTPDDTGRDGSRTSYLFDPNAWGGYDPVVYGFLRHQVIDRGVREVRAIHEAGILSNCQFFDDHLVDDSDGRNEYFDRFFELSDGSDLVFFDPDNGLAVKSVGRGKPRSSKYLFEVEVSRALDQDHSVLLYQHFPRTPRDAFVTRLAARLGALGAAEWMFAFRTSHVVFVLLPQPRHALGLLERGLRIGQMWGAMMTVEAYRLCGRGVPCRIGQPDLGAALFDRDEDLASAGRRGLGFKAAS